MAVIDNLDEPSPARLDANVDAGGAGIQSVLDQLLDDGGRALDDLARGDAVDNRAVEHADGFHGLILVDAVDASCEVPSSGAATAA